MEGKVSKFEGTLKYQNHIFAVSVSINDYGYATIEGYTAKKTGGNNKFLEYLLMTLRFMLSE
jgi:hypothetical protein